MNSTTDVFTFLHFNDVYDVESAEKLDICGGAARFASVVKRFEHLQPTILFGGDCFSPSLLSNFTQGKHMVDVLNALKVDCAVVGNHDFDFGVDELEELCDQCKFPWLLSNVYDRDTEKILANAKTTHVIEKNGRKFGLIGLVEEEWLATLPTVDVDDVDFLDFVEEGRLLAQKLKNEGCDFIIALTHMRWPNNVRLAECVDEVDLILAGHDHFYRCEKINGKIVVVSGCEFRQLTRLTVNFTKSGAQVEAEQLNVTSDVIPDISMVHIIDGYSALVSKQLDVILGRLKTSLDGRFSVVRSRESNLGNFMCDIVYSAVNTDVVMINSGTFRSDRIHDAGPFKHRDLQQILPYLDPMVVIEITGKQLLAALENSVSQCPKMEGRFAQVAGIRFTFDTSAPAYQRIIFSSIVIGGEKLKLDRTYRLCTKYYLAQGNDGYTVFKDCPVIIDIDNAPILSTMVQNYFVGIQVAQGLKRKKSVHRQSIISLRPFLNVDDQPEGRDSRSGSHSGPRSNLLHDGRSGSHSGRRSSLLKKRSSTIEELEQFGVLSPIIDGRMTNLFNENIIADLTIKTGN